MLSGQGSSSGSERTPLIARTHEGQSRAWRWNWKRTLIWSTGTVLVLGLVLGITLSAVLTASSGFLFHILSSLSNLSTCSTCFSLLVPIRQLALLGDSAFTNTFTNLCIDLGIQPDYICRGAVARQAPVIAQSLRQIQPNKRTAAALCTKLFGLCSSRGEPVPDWPQEFLPLPSTHKAQPRQRSGRTRKVVQITDLHIDRLYKVGAEAACGEILCCRNSSSILTSTGEPHWPAGPFGNPHCDTPFALFRSMLDEIAKVAGDAAFVVSTGDIPSHAVWEDTQETASRDILEAFAIMRSVLKMPVYGAIGNHDIAPVNLFPRSTSRKAFAASQWVYDLHYNAWRDWIGSAVTRASFTDTAGSYSIDVHGMDVKVISVNTNYWSSDNFYLFDTDYPNSDPEGILTFVIRELQDAETRGLRAVLIGHAAPSVAFPAQSHYFDQIVQRYRSTVVAQLYGHTHSADFIVGYSTPAYKTPDTASTISFVSASLTPFGGVVNPGFRVYELDEVTGEVWDWKEYYTNITDPEFKHGPQWQILYSARQEYGHHVDGSQGQPLTPSFWHTYAMALGESSEAFTTFIFNKYRGAGLRGRPRCTTERCRKSVLCSLLRSRSEDRCISGAVASGTDLKAEEIEPVSVETPGFGMKQLLSEIAHKAKDGKLMELKEHPRYKYYRLFNLIRHQAS